MVYAGHFELAFRSGWCKKKYVAPNFAWQDREFFTWIILKTSHFLWEKLDFQGIHNLHVTLHHSSQEGQLFTIHDQLGLERAMEDIGMGMGRAWTFVRPPQKKRPYDLKYVALPKTNS